MKSKVNQTIEAVKNPLLDTRKQEVLFHENGQYQTEKPLLQSTSAELKVHFGRYQAVTSSAEQITYIDKQGVRSPMLKVEIIIDNEDDERMPVRIVKPWPFETDSELIGILNVNIPPEEESLLLDDLVGIDIEIELVILECQDWQSQEVLSIRRISENEKTSWLL